MKTNLPIPLPNTSIPEYFYIAWDGKRLTVDCTAGTTLGRNEISGKTVIIPHFKSKIFRYLEKVSKKAIKIAEQDSLGCHYYSDDNGGRP